MVLSYLETWAEKMQCVSCLQSPSEALIFNQKVLLSKNYSSLKKRKDALCCFCLEPNIFWHSMAAVATLFLMQRTSGLPAILGEKCQKCHRHPWAKKDLHFYYTEVSKTALLNIRLQFGKQNVSLNRCDKTPPRKLLLSVIFSSFKISI